MSKEDRQNRGGAMNLRQAEEMCRRHAKTCRKCFVPIVDEEGNPQYESEACADGAKLLCMLAGMGRFRTPHSLRHTWASQMIAAGEDIASVSKHLGHANVGITLSIYIHFLPKKKRLPGNILDRTGARSMKIIEVSRLVQRGCQFHSKIPAAALEPKFLKQVLVITPEDSNGTTIQSNFPHDPLWAACNFASAGEHEQSCEFSYPRWHQPTIIAATWIG